MMELELDGLIVNLRRSTVDGSFLIEVDSENVDESDQHDEVGVPKVRFIVNEGAFELDAEGDIVDVDRMSV